MEPGTRVLTFIQTLTACQLFCLQPDPPTKPEVCQLLISKVDLNNRAFARRLALLCSNKILHSLRMMFFAPAVSRATRTTLGAIRERYDFDGQPGNTYSLFSAPQHYVAIHQAGDGPGVHFMT